MTPRFLPNHPGGCEINGIQKSREKQYWKGFGIKLSLDHINSDSYYT